MKIKCDFCKTEYAVDSTTHGPVRCALCGHVWSVARGRRVNAILVVISAICALMAAAVFAAAVITQSRIDAARAAALVPTVTQIQSGTDDTGADVITVTGNITNNTDDIYGMPDVVITARDDTDNVIVRHKVMPSATLIDAHGVVPFTYTIPAGAEIKKISVDLMGV